jgi:large subunit ribosomal protein L30
MLQKVKDYVTWGEVKQEVLSTLISSYGKLVGGEKITDEYIKSNTQHSSINAFAKTIFDNKEQYSNLKDVKPVIRLHPPIKGYEGIKRAYSVGGALGYRGDAINQLLQRMVLEE